MKTKPTSHNLHRRQQLTTLAMNIGLFAGLSALPLHAQNNENTRSGSTGDEWYNPGNWSSGNNSERGSNWSSDDGWSSTADNQARRNQQQDRSGIQSQRNQQQHRSDMQSQRNQQQHRSDMQSQRNQHQDRSDMQSQRNQQQDRGGMQSQRNQQQEWSDRNPQSQRNQEQSMKTVIFNGEVDGFKKVNLTDSQGKRDEHTFVRIRLDDDDARVVSLGSRLIVTDLDLEKGDRISVSGRNARIDNQNVIVASRIEVDDKLFLVREHNRPVIEQRAQQRQYSQQGQQSQRAQQGQQYGQQGPQGQQSQYGQQAQQGQQMPIEGTVKDVSKTSLSDDSREESLLIRLELENGETCVVDLGQGTSLDDLDIEQGSKIRVQGHKTQVDGKSLIVASAISVDGDTTRVLSTPQRDGRARPDGQ